MSIETEVKKLTTAINRIADYCEANGLPSGVQCDGVEGQPVPIPATVIEQQPVQQLAPQQPVQQVPQQQPVVPTQQVQQAIPVQPAGLDDNSINQILVAEAARLGETGAQKIIALLQQFGATRVADVPPANRPQLIAAVQGLV